MVLIYNLFTRGKVQFDTIGNECQRVVPSRVSRNGSNKRVKVHNNLEIRDTEIPKDGEKCPI